MRKRKCLFRAEQCGTNELFGLVVKASIGLELVQIQSVSVAASGVKLVATWNKVLKLERYQGGVLTGSHGRSYRFDSSETPVRIFPIQAFQDNLTLTRALGSSRMSRNPEIGDRNRNI